MAINVTVDLPDDVVGAVQDYALKHNLKMSEAMGEMIKKQYFLSSEALKGSKVLLEKAGTFREIDITPSKSKG
jgi:hypothetical protein